jgi:hypothetical protein
MNIPKEDMENYHWAMFIHAMDFSKERANLKKLILEHFFTKLFKDLSIKDLVTFCNQLSIEFMKFQKQLYAILGRQTWVPQKIKEPKSNDDINILS